MKKDIVSKFDIDKLVKVFYKRVTEDPQLSRYFMKKEDKEPFLNTVKLFWENVVFFTGSYNGNPMEIHRDIHKKMPLTSESFTIWLDIFYSTVDELFEGTKAEFIKQRAKSIATVMQVKILDT